MTGDGFCEFELVLLIESLGPAGRVPGMPVLREEKVRAARSFASFHVVSFSREAGTSSTLHAISWACFGR